MPSLTYPNLTLRGTSPKSQGRTLAYLKYVYHIFHVVHTAASDDGGVTNE